MLKNCVVVILDCKTNQKNPHTEIFRHFLHIFLMFVHVFRENLKFFRIYSMFFPVIDPLSTCLMWR